MDSEAMALSEWQDRLKRKDQILDFVQEKALPVLLWFGFAPLVANFLGTDLGEDPITGEPREYPIPPIVGVLSFTLVLITGALLAWQRGEVKQERHRLAVAAGWEEPSSTDDLDSTGEETGAGFTPAESGGAGHIVRCDACGTKNRLSRASAGHTCGKCGADLLGEDTVVEAKPIIPKSQPDARKQRHPALEALANPVLQGGMGAVGLVFAVYQTAG